MRYWYLHLLRLLSSDGEPADDHKLDFGFFDRALCAVRPALPMDSL